MAEITASLVKELRDRTNAGMMDCKRALAENNGDMDEAIKYLREKGIAKAASKADRVAKEGIITARLGECGKSGVLFEVNCETDFVSKNENFQAFVADLADTVSASRAADLDAALALQKGTGSVEDFIKSKVLEIGENMMMRRFSRFALPAGTNGAVASYIHMAGKVGVLLEVSAEKAETAQTEEFKSLVKDLTLHIAASAPQSLARQDLDAKLVENERDIFRTQATASGKPAEIIEKMIDGRMSKYYAEVCLLEQPFIKDDSQTIGKLVEATGKKLGDSLKVTSFVRYAVGA